MENNNEMMNQVPESDNPEVVNTPDDGGTIAKKPFPKWLIAVFAGAIALVVAAVILLLPRHDEYKITVIDEIGNPISNVMVTITDKKGASKTKITDKEGQVVFTEVLVGKNTVTVDPGLSENISVLSSSYQLNKKCRELRVIVRDERLAQNIYGVVPDGTVGYSVSVGTYNLPTTAGNTSYLVFAAVQPGIYKVSFTSNDSGMTVGHYGIPMYVQPTHSGDLNYDGKSFELIIKDIATPYVIGVNCTTTTDAILTIERIGDAPFDPNYDAEWIDVQIDRNPVECNLSGKTLVDVDISRANLNLTLNDDGYYYIDGKRVYIRITTTTSYGSYDEELHFAPVVNGSLALLAGFVDDKVGVNLGGHVYDETGAFVAKYKYNSLIGTYMEYADDKYGVVPLTEQLADCIKLHGESSGWFDPEKPGYLFNDINVNDEISWLFLCMVEQ